MKVHIPSTPDALDVLQAQLDPAIELTIGPEIPQPAEYEILVSGRPSREELSASPHLRALVIPWAGLTTEARDLGAEFPQVAVHNLHHNASMTAEMALTLLLSAARFLLPYDRSLRANDWSIRYKPNPSMSLAGKTALILGYGRIGRRVARVLQALDMNVLATRRHPVEAYEDGVEIHGPGELHDLLPQADVLIIILPATAETEGLIGPAEIAAMPVGSILINVGRGPIVDQYALYDALKSGHLRAAGSDVWYHYPPSAEESKDIPPADVPFNELDNFIMSPHRGGLTTDTEPMRMTHLARLLNAAARGEEMPNQIDLELGY
ncbi:MAG: 2-hydroxyacid dehydrogenase [Anaerolineaceae bacterium]|jgi:phosphoglycerate dehydrogenase-like enzyme|nr:2-hydroxyacid dehydrogenase [Anaerolineaceae bacterium]